MHYLRRERRENRNLVEMSKCTHLGKSPHLESDHWPVHRLVLSRVSEVFFWRCPVFNPESSTCRAHSPRELWPFPICLLDGIPDDLHLSHEEGKKYWHCPANPQQTQLRHHCLIVLAAAAAVGVGSFLPERNATFQGSKDWRMQKGKQWREHEGTGPMQIMLEFQCNATYGTPEGSAKPNSHMHL